MPIHPLKRVFHPPLPPVLLLLLLLLLLRRVRVFHVTNNGLNKNKKRITQTLKIFNNPPPKEGRTTTHYLLSSAKSGSMGVAWGVSAQYSASKAWKACSGRHAARLVLVAAVALLVAVVASVGDDGDDGDDIRSASLGVLVLALDIIVASVPSRTISKGREKRKRGRGRRKGVLCACACVSGVLVTAV